MSDVAAPVTITLPPPLMASYQPEYTGDGATWPADQCGYSLVIGCGQPIEDGTPVRKVRQVWLHEACALKQIAAADVDAAWLLLADQIIQRPSAFRASDIKVVLRSVAAIAQRGRAS